ncbi:transcription initiation factor tfiid subunit related [Cyclospora cayetanensis]|uniref:Transcription initiation factor tfiid subunit related n=1 Tax=Cyclospora cayetanensis TaxID=88456 RepID=A0A1D3D0H5_9EIME|nr:transcription initiation factor tfiid subunit related [Cyclospora cayetanensis]
MAARGVGPVVAAAYTRLYVHFVSWVVGLWDPQMQQELLDAAFAVLLKIFQRTLLINPKDAHDLLRVYGQQHAARHGPLVQQLLLLQPQHPQQLKQFPYFQSEEKHSLYLSERSFLMLRRWLAETRSLPLEALLQSSGIDLAPLDFRGCLSTLHLCGPLYPFYRLRLLFSWLNGCVALLALWRSAYLRVRVVGQEALRESELVEARCLLPLPEASTEAFLLLRKQLKSQAEARAPLSPTQLPSVCCYTFMNSQQETCSVALGRQKPRFAAMDGPMLSVAPFE